MRKTLIIGGLAALTLGAASVAVAQQAPARPMRSAEPVSRTDFVARHVDRLTAADTNRDGTVTAEERAAVRDSRRAERASTAFDRLDADKDGSISRAEFEARPQRAERGRHAGARAGRHGPARAARMERGPVVIAEAQAKAEQRFDRMDANRDGTLSADERRAVRQAMREHRQERRAARASQQSPQAPASE